MTTSASGVIGTRGATSPTTGRAPGHAPGHASRAPRDSRRVIFGDFQTPDALARDVVQVVRAAHPDVRSVLEPTCGRGAFLVAAAEAFPDAVLFGVDVSPTYVAAARERVPRAHIEAADFFRTDWSSVIERLAEPVLVLGNPPWVTNAALGSLDADNLPAKSNFERHVGLDALTGKSNFDISEWMIMHLLEAAHARRVVLAMLCKASVARRVMAGVAARGLAFDGSLRTIDARTHFAAAVEAVLLTVASAPAAPPAAIAATTAPAAPVARWAVYPSLAASTPARHIGVVDGNSCSDWEAYHRTRDLEGTSEIEWRSGVKHDAAATMELTIIEPNGSTDPRGQRRLANGLGEEVDLENEYVYPLLKGSDVAHGRLAGGRRVIVTQSGLGDDTAAIRERAPATWSYLVAHRAELERRKSSIYRGQPEFAMFGVGSYSFALYKVAISALYKRLAFSLIEPVDGRPVMLDDTCYFLPCESRAQGIELVNALNGPQAKAFFEARIFWDAKRPISKSLLQSLSLSALGVSSRLRSASDG